MSLCESVCGGIFTRFLLLLYLWFYLIFSSLPMNHFLPSHLHVFTFRHRLPLSLLMPRSWWLLVCRNAWWCFPFEAMEALSCHLMWVAAATYCSILAPKSLLATLIGVLGMAHFSLGKCNYTLFQMRISIHLWKYMETSREVQIQIAIWIRMKQCWIQQRHWLGCSGCFWDWPKST